MMHITALFAIVIAVSASPLPGLLYDKPHHTPEVLDNIHQTPYCAYTCIFDESYPGRFAPECGGIEGKELGACLCRANGYQYMLDQCNALKCNKDERKKAREMNVKSCEHYGVKKEEMFKLEEVK